MDQTNNSYNANQAGNEDESEFIRHMVLKNLMLWRNRITRLLKVGAGEWRVEDAAEAMMELQFAYDRDVGNPFGSLRAACHVFARDYKSALKTFQFVLNLLQSMLENYIGNKIIVRDQACIGQSNQNSRYLH